MRRVFITLVIVGTAMLAGGAALAKGPSGATITGPGIDEPIELGVEDDLLWTLSEQSGFTSMMFQHPIAAGSGPLKMPPVGDLGPMYVVTFDMGDVSIPLEIFPDAPLGPIADSPDRPNGPLVHVADSVDPAVFGNDDARMFTWYKPVAALNRTLVSLGVPLELAEAPAPVTTVVPSTLPATTVPVTVPVQTPATPADPTVPMLPIAVLAAGGVAAAAVVGATRRRRSLAG